MHRVKVTVTTDGSGDAVAYSPRLAGKVHSASYIKPVSGSYTDGVDFTITSEATGEQIWVESNVNATAYRYPRAATHSQLGVAALFAAAGSPVQDKIGLAQDRIKIVVAQGGAAKVGAFHFCID
jgi:hypothetical protein